MKTCARCKTEKQPDQFYTNPKTGRINPYCYPCQKEYGRERAVKARALREASVANA